MPLSEHEQRMLDEIERALYEDDPKFATSVNVIATQSLLAVGVIVSVVGFLTMFAAVGLFVFGQPGARAAKGMDKGPDKAGPSLGNRMEERFRRRFDEPNQ